jgi:integrase
MGSIYRRKYKDKLTGKVKLSSVWWVQYYRSGIPIRESANTASQAEAKRFLSLREGDVAKGMPITPQMGRIKFSEMAEDEINDYKANGRRTLKDLETRFRLHIIPFFGESRASAITTGDIRRYVTRRQEEKASNAQINRELTVIKRAFSLAAEAGKILAKPHIPMLKENNVRTGFFERDQFECVLKHLPDANVRDLITFAYITGWRIRSEVRFLQWPQVDFNAGIVRLEPGITKNDEARIFPLTQELRAVLESRNAIADALKKRGIICPYVFNRKGKPIKAFRRTWESACKAAGVPGKIPHDFRRSAVRNLGRAVVPEAVSMKLTGHKTRSVFERYNIVSEGDLFLAARYLDSVWQT